MKTFLRFTCENCKTMFDREIRQTHGKPVRFCSKLCRNSFPKTKVEKHCAQCNLVIEVPLRDIRESKSGNNFCNRSCAAVYNNTHKTSGTRVSKLELWLQSKLTEKYPDLEVHYNRKDAINSELDIFIPKLNLAFELNGVFHYEPIFGLEKLTQIQNNDQRKFQACLERGIELCIIDVNHMKHFKEQKANQFFEIIDSLVMRKLAK